MLREADEEEKLVYRRGYYGFLLCIIGPTIFFYFPNFMAFVIQYNFRLDSDDSSLTEYWKEPPVPMYAYIYLFNITNPKDILNGITPDFQEIGPYIVRVKMIKDGITWNSEDATVSYNSKFRFFYDEKMAGVGENDNMFIFNLPLASIVTLIKDFPVATNPSSSELIDKNLNKERLMKKVKVKDFLLNGIRADLFKTMSEVLGKHVNLSNLSQYKSFSILQMLNSTQPANIVAHTGVKGIEAVGEIKSLETESPTKVWDDTYCNKVNGTEGQNFRHPVIHRYQYFYLHPLCRSMKLDYVGNDDINSIPTKKFIFNSMFTSRIYIPHNTCFCRSTGKFCTLNGTVSLAPCFGGLPITISKPHFYGADPYFYENVTGLQPVPDDHESYFHLHTMLSLPLLVRICLQFNIRITGDEKIRLFSKLNDMMVPIMWMNTTLDIRTTGNEEMAYYLLVGPPFAAKVIGGILTGIGAIRLGRALFYPIISKNKQNETSSVKVYPLDVQPEFKDPITKTEKY